MEKLSREEKQASGGKIGGASFFNIITGAMATIGAFNFLFELIGKTSKGKSYSESCEHDCSSHEDSIYNLFSKAELQNLKNEEQNRIIIYPYSEKSAK